MDTNTKDKNDKQIHKDKKGHGKPHKHKGKDKHRKKSHSPKNPIPDKKKIKEGNHKVSPPKKDTDSEKS